MDEMPFRSCRTRFGSEPCKIQLHEYTSGDVSLTFDVLCICQTYLVTSRKPRDDEKDGQAYRFVSRVEMEADVKAGRYLEHGEYEGNLYGTKIDSILEVVQTGRTCILDVNPQVCWSNTIFK